MFLQLLVAQIKNQDPMSPTDGVQFLTQLAQFQQLEQRMNTGQDLTAIRADLDKIASGAIPHKLIRRHNVHFVFNGSFGAQRHRHGSRCGR